MASDNVCLGNNTNSCVQDFAFFEITKATGSFPNNGILGLGPIYASSGPSYMQALFNSSMISEFKLSFQLNYANVTGSLANYADFGVPVSQRGVGSPTTIGVVRD
jgi:hypothetical protein